MILYYCVQMNVTKDLRVVVACAPEIYISIRFIDESDVAPYNIIVVFKNARISKIASAA